MRIPFTVFSLAILLGVTCLEAGPFSQRIRRSPRRVCCLKDYGYATSEFSAPVTGVSLTATELKESRSKQFTYQFQESDIKTFPLRESNLTIDHCRIQSVAMKIQRDGTWSIDLTAIQNPALVSAQVRPRFVRFAQNEFLVTVRVYQNYPLATDPNRTELARGAVVTVPVKSFWVKSEVKPRLSGKCQDLERHFDIIDRIEIDFQYR